MTKVLFACVHNTGRSQMAEAFLNALAGDRCMAESAGLTPGTLNSLVVEAMKEIGIDISNNKVKSAFDFYKAGKRYNYVVSVCDDAISERCPIFPGTIKRLRWPFQDPAKLTGTYEERLQGTRIIRDKIRSRIEEWLKEEERDAAFAK
ncbi:MAG TPA: arsenate reductase ArsC [Nitrospiraceae bacterium]|nr:arsenate reductase ArsC [Nitrospiraceae bacterium]